MNHKLWTAINDLDTVATNQEAAQDAFAYILTGLDKAAAKARRGGQETPAAFLSHYGTYSRMLFLLLDVMQGQNKDAKALIAKAFEIQADAGKKVASMSEREACALTKSLSLEQQKQRLLTFLRVLDACEIQDRIPDDKSVAKEVAK